MHPLARAVARLSATATAIVLALSVALPASAQAPAVSTATGSITVIIVDQALHPVGGVAVDISGTASKRASTDVTGTNTFTDLPVGLYRVNITKAGFTPLTQEDVAVVAGQVTTTRVTLQPSSFDSIKEIGRVTATRNAAGAINTSTAAVSTVSGSSFIDQGSLGVIHGLNEIPGLAVGLGTRFNDDKVVNGASPLVTGIPELRGSLPYETESLIDGHPISIGQYGTFNPIFVSPYILEDVEVVKGPGASPPNINYAIGGTVNFRTLEPTRAPHESVDLGIDQFGGQNANFRMTGTAGAFSYATDFAMAGTQGYDRGFDPLDPPNGSTGILINGVAACTVASNKAQCSPTVKAGAPNYAAASNLFAPLVLTGINIPMESSQRNELMKLRYGFTPSTTLTVSYVGAQARGSAYAADLYSFPSYFFGPPTGYTGSIPSGTPLPFNLQGDSALDTNANLFQAEFHAALGPVTLIARDYSANVNTFNGGPGDGPTPGTETFNGILYGGVPSGASGTPTIYNGVPATVTITNAYSAIRSLDVLNGYTIEADLPIADNVFSLSYDNVRSSSTATKTASIASLDSNLIPAGSAQTFQTLMARAQFQLGPVAATLSNYALLYKDNYTQDGGLSFLSSTHAFDAPRLALGWRPNRDTSVRASAGFSVAPAYINLLTNTPTPVANRNPPTYFTLTGNSGDVSPETSFGLDLGADRRIVRDTVLSADIYETTLHNQFISTTSLDGTYTPPVGSIYPNQPYPLYLTKTANLGLARYEGIELALHRDPAIGFGYKVQGSLQRGYAYGLPSDIYATAAGPFTANLGVIPNINFEPSGQGYNGLSMARVPYAQGYAELNGRTRTGGFGLIGVTYYGNDNSYNVPPFFVVNASYRQPLGKHVSLLLAVQNVTNVLGNYYFNIYGGIPVPLANGQLGYTPSNVIGPSTTSLTLHFGL